jgi:hypothetical protein
MLEDVNCERKEVSLSWRNNKVSISQFLEIIKEDTTGNEETRKLAMNLLQLSNPISGEEELLKIVKNLTEVKKTKTAKAETTTAKTSQPEAKGTEMPAETETHTEESVQRALFKEWSQDKYPQGYLFDTHSSPLRMPMFKMPFSEDETLPASAKVDFLSTMAPMMLELKQASSDFIGETVYELLYQMVERVVLAARVNETLRRVVAFGTTGRTAWMFMMLRSFSENGKQEENYHFFPLDPKLIFGLWHAYNDLCSRNPLIYATENSFQLARILRTLGYHPSYCKIININRTKYRSISRITPAQKSELHTEAIIRGQDHALNSICIKLSFSPRGESECEIINHLTSKPVCNNMNYVIATLSFRQDPKKTPATEWNVNPVNTFFLHRNHLIVDSNGKVGSPTVNIDLAGTATSKDRFSKTFFWPSVQSTNACTTSVEHPELWWWNFENDRFRGTQNFTAIVMYYMVSSLLDDSNYSSPLVEALHDIHHRKVVHCDIRAANILLFDIPIKNTPNLTNFVNGCSSPSKVVNPNNNKDEKDENAFTYLPTKIYLTDFDLAMMLPDGNTHVSFQVSEEGHQREMINHANIPVENRTDGRKYVNWSPTEDMKMAMGLGPIQKELSVFVSKPSRDMAVP